MAEVGFGALAARVWEVGALCRAVSDALESRFNPVAVRGEVSGFSRASSGHCYFTLKDGQGQLRCAMFRRAALQLDAPVRDGEVVEVWGRLGVYEARGDLQLVVERMQRAGQGALFEQFLRLKARLEAQGLFDPGRKRPLVAMPRGIGLVTSPAAAALHDTMTTLRRRAPHVPVVFAPASVQGQNAASELVAALEALYAHALAGNLDVILLVRGGGSLEDLWSFNDEALARAIVRSPVPLVCGVGHETDFTIADFCADVRAATPTAAAELAARARDDWLTDLDADAARLERASRLTLDRASQRIDQAAFRLGRPLAVLARHGERLGRLAQTLRAGARLGGVRAQHALDRAAERLHAAPLAWLGDQRQRQDRLALRLQLLDPQQVLERGYALLADSSGQVVTRAAQIREGQHLVARLADGEVALRVSSRISNRP